MLAGYKSENEKLRERIQELEVERNQLLEAEATNRRLQQLLEFRSQLPSGRGDRLDYRQQRQQLV